jgi:hypothetical protein
MNLNVILIENRVDAVAEVKKAFEELNQNIDLSNIKRVINKELLFIDDTIYLATEINGLSYNNYITTLINDKELNIDTLHIFSEGIWEKEKSLIIV